MIINHNFKIQGVSKTRKVLKMLLHKLKDDENLNVFFNNNLKTVYQHMKYWSDTELFMLNIIQ